MIDSQKVGGVFFSGGKNGSFYGVILELFKAEESRWVIKSLFNSDKVAPSFKEESFIEWISSSGCKKFVTDIPIGESFCGVCTLDCPGQSKCIDPKVKNINLLIDDLLGEDLLHSRVRPKEYERLRESLKSFDHSRDWFNEKTELPPLSQSFKRKLKGGFIPFWHRSIDLFIWIGFYDQMLKILNYSFDSFGHTSLMIINRFKYIKNLLGPSYSFFESNINVVLIQLLKNKIIDKNHLNGLRFLDETTIEDKKSLVLSLENNLNLFAYESDILDLILDPKMVHAFLLAISGKSLVENNIVKLPSWCEEKFLIPTF